MADKFAGYIDELFDYTTIRVLDTGYVLLFAATLTLTGINADSPLASVTSTIIKLV